MTQLQLGQRWISEPEPELGLGTVAALAAQQADLDTHLQADRLRLDAVRLLRRNPG